MRKTGPPPVFTGCELTINGLSAEVRFCSPQTDADGDLIPSGALGSCTVTLDGVVVDQPIVTEPGTVFSMTVNGKNLGHQIGAFCTNADGVDGGVWVSDLCFPFGTPRPPHHVK